MTKDKLIKINIDVEENYPVFVYTIEGHKWFDEKDKTFLCREDKIEWIKNTTQEYDKVQEYLKKKYGWED